MKEVVISNFGDEQTGDWRLEKGLGAGAEVVFVQVGSTYVESVWLRVVPQRKARQGKARQGKVR